MGIKKQLLAGVLVSSLVLGGLIGCVKQETQSPVANQPVKVGDKYEYRFEFKNGLEGWYGGFADYPSDPEEKDFYETEFKYVDIPVEGSTAKGIYLSGMNRSDDLFMFAANKLGGLKPNTEYKFEFSFDLATNVPTGLFGIGGSPSDSVFLKVGFTTTKPEPIEGDLGYPAWVMNIDKGNQSQEGKEMKVIGTIGKEDADEDDDSYQFKSFKDTFTAKTDKDGNIYMIIGTDSGFEGKSSLYYTNIVIVAEEVK